MVGCRATAARRQQVPWSAPLACPARPRLITSRKCLISSGTSGPRSLKGASARCPPPIDGRDPHEIAHWTSAGRSRWVAAKIRTSVLMGLEAPRGVTSRAWSARRRRTWLSKGNSPTSSRKSVPPCASWKCPFRSDEAPVKAPRLCPNSSELASSGGNGTAVHRDKWARQLESLLREWPRRRVLCPFRSRRVSARERHALPFAEPSHLLGHGVTGVKDAIELRSKRVLPVRATRRDIRALFRFRYSGRKSPARSKGKSTASRPRCVEVWIRLAGNLVFDRMIQIAAMAGVPGLRWKVSSTSSLGNDNPSVARSRTGRFRCVVDGTIQADSRQRPPKTLDTAQLPPATCSTSGCVAWVVCQQDRHARTAPLVASAVASGPNWSGRTPSAASWSALPIQLTNQRMLPIWILPVGPLARIEVCT
jgi:hypothetical protein